MPGDPVARRDYNWTPVCESCYLSICCYPYSRLSMYCPEIAGKRFGVEPAAVLEISRAVGVNRRWEFYQKVRAAGGG